MTLKRRLPLVLYKGGKRVTFTLCTSERRNLFVETEIVSVLLGFLREAHEKTLCRNWVYVFMPDHLHLVSEGHEGCSDLLRMISRFKQHSGFWFRRKHSAVLWQTSFYDHIHRSKDDLKAHMLYLFENPVRKGLAGRWRDYPYLGSLDFDVDRMLSTIAEDE